MKKRETQAKVYNNAILKEQIKLNYGIDYSVFEQLKTCTLGEKSAQIKNEKISPYISSWFLQGNDLEKLLQNPNEAEFKDNKNHLANKLCSNIVLLGLNAGSMSKMTNPWHFFHKRFNKSNTDYIETASERYLKEYLTKCHLPFEGAYMTDILKFQDKNNSLYIERILLK